MVWLIHDGSVIKMWTMVFFSEKLARILRRENVKIGYKPINTLHFQNLKINKKLNKQEA